MDQHPRISDSEICHVMASKSITSPEARILAGFEARALPLIQRSTVPLFAADRNALDQSGPIHVVRGDPFAEIGTATLFEKDGRRFLITTGHNILDWEENHHEVRVAVNGRPHPLRPAIDTIEFDNDLDLAVVRLNVQAAKCFSHATLLSDCHIDLEDDWSGGSYVIPGFLAHRSAFSNDKRVLSLARYCLWTRPLLKQSLQRFVLLEFPMEPVVERNQLDAIPALRTAGGMSGANVWRIWHDSDDLDKWKAVESIRCVALQVAEAEDHSYLKCTPWKYVMPLIEKLSV